VVLRNASVAVASRAAGASSSTESGTWVTHSDNPFE
jgi:hypothetical protein